MRGGPCGENTHAGDVSKGRVGTGWGAWGPPKPGSAICHLYRLLPGTLGLPGSLE